MYKRAVDEICRNGFGALTLLCARPGDGRMTVAVALADKLADSGAVVCACSFTLTAEQLRKKLSQKVRVLSAFPESAPAVFEKLQSERPVAGTVVVVENLSAAVLSESSENRLQKKTELLAQLKELAERLGIQVVVTDTFSHAADTDEQLPVSGAALELCNTVYIVYKDDIGAGDTIDEETCRLKLKKIR